MNPEIEKILFDFDNMAKEEFFYLFEKLKSAAKRLDRKRDENVFQLQVAKFTDTLKRQLKMHVKESINKNFPSGLGDLLNKMLTDKIHYYQNEFRQKAESL